MGKKILASILLGGVLCCIYLCLPEPSEPKALTAAPETPVAIIEKPSDVWTEFRPSSNQFVVSMPVRPQHASDSMPTPNSDELIHYDLYVAQTRLGTTFMINVIQYPPSFDVSNTEEILGSVIREMVAGNIKNQLTTSEHKTIQNCPVSDFFIKNPEAMIRGRAILKNRTLYVLSIADRHQERIDAAFSPFADSFTFVQ